MARIQDGHLDLLGILYVRYCQKSYAQAISKIGDAAAAEDLVHEAFLRVLRYRDSFRGDSQFSTWLYRIVSNVCIDYLKAASKAGAGLRELAVHVSVVDPQHEPGVEERSVLREAFEQLSEPKQRLLVMSRIDGVGYAEIALFLGVSEGAARVRVHRAVSELRSYITDQPESGQ